METGIDTADQEARYDASVKRIPEEKKAVLEKDSEIPMSTEMIEEANAR